MEYVPSPPLDLLVRGFEDFVAAAAQAAQAGPAGEAALVRALDVLPKSRRAIAVAYLGDARGPAGPPALRHVLTSDRAAQDERCAAILALAKREKERAAPDYARTFSSRDAAVKAYSLAALAAYGDERARPHVATYLSRRLKRNPAALVPNPTVLGICYLVRYSDRNRLVALAEAIRGAEDHLRAERANRIPIRLGADVVEWLEKFWPACLDPAVEVRRVTMPDAQAMQDWVRSDPLFGPV